MHTEESATTGRENRRGATSSAAFSILTFPPQHLPVVNPCIPEIPPVRHKLNNGYPSPVRDVTLGPVAPGAGECEERAAGIAIRIAIQWRSRLKASRRS